MKNLSIIQQRMQNGDRRESKDNSVGVDSNKIKMRYVRQKIGSKNETRGVEEMKYDTLKV